MKGDGSGARSRDGEIKVREGGNGTGMVRRSADVVDVVGKLLGCKM